MAKKGLSLTGNLYLFSCKKGVKIAANILETSVPFKALWRTIGSSP